MPVYRLNKNKVDFPIPTEAEQDGLLAVGGDLSMERLLLAYTHGIFPWYNPGDEIMWWCPHDRFLLFPNEVHISKSMQKFLKKQMPKIVFNRDFKDTMHQCRKMREDKEGTWITDEMEEAYWNLHLNGYALSLEAFYGEELAGGLYGVIIGQCFFGESMFSLKENGSKIALIALSERLEQNDFLFIDCQFHTEHLESMGGRYVSWVQYDQMLQKGARS